MFSQEINELLGPLVKMECGGENSCCEGGNPGVQLSSINETHVIENC